MHLKMTSAECQPFCFALILLVVQCPVSLESHYSVGSHFPEDSPFQVNYIFGFHTKSGSRSDQGETWFRIKMMESWIIFPFLEYSTLMFWFIRKLGHWVSSSKTPAVFLKMILIGRVSSAAQHTLLWRLTYFEWWRWVASWRHLAAFPSPRW